MKSRIISFLIFLFIVNIQSFSQWTTYGANSQRTSTVPGLIDSIGQLWTYNQSSQLPTTYTHTGNITADGSRINLKYEVYDLAVNGNHRYSLIDVINSDGQKVLTTVKMGLNHSESTWPMKLNGYLYINDDNIQRANDVDGATNWLTDKKRTDVWGSLLPVGNNFVTTQSTQSETNVILGIRMYDHSFNVVWYKDYIQRGRDINRGATCYDNGKVFHAPDYFYGFDPIPGYSGVYCLDASNGNQLWFVQTKPTGAISAKDGKLFGYENSELVCRDQSNGLLLWAKPLNGITRGQPPVLGNNSVIVADLTGIRAYDFSGNEAWSSNIKAVHIAEDYNNENTIMAANENTLVVTTDEGIYLLNKSNGQTKQFIEPVIPSGYRATNPIIIGNRLYINIAGKNFISTPFHRVVAFGQGVFIPPPVDTTQPPPPTDTTTNPPPAIPSVVLSASGITLSWVVSNLTVKSQQLERRWTGKGRKKWETIYTGNSPYNGGAGYEYRVIVNSTYYSNIVKL